MQLFEIFEYLSLVHTGDYSAFSVTIMGLLMATSRRKRPPIVAS